MLDCGVKTVAESVPVGFTVFVGGPEVLLLVSVGVGAKVELPTSEDVTAGVTVGISEELIVLVWLAVVVGVTSALVAFAVSDVVDAVTVGTLVGVVVLVSVAEAVFVPVVLTEAVLDAEIGVEDALSVEMDWVALSVSVEEVVFDSVAVPELVGVVVGVIVPVSELVGVEVIVPVSELVAVDET